MYYQIFFLSISMYYRDHLEFRGMHKPGLVEPQISSLFVQFRLLAVVRPHKQLAVSWLA